MRRDVPASRPPAYPRGFDAVLTLSPDLLEEFGLTEHGHAAEATARLAVERLPGAMAVRVNWRGPMPGTEAPPLVGVFPLGSVAAVEGQVWRNLGRIAEDCVRDALRQLSRQLR